MPDTNFAEPFSQGPHLSGTRRFDYTDDLPLLPARFLEPPGLVWGSFAAPDGAKLRWGHLAGRRKDLVDVSAVIAFKGDKLDWPYIEGWCDRHGSRPLLEQLRAELR